LLRHAAGSVRTILDDASLVRSSGEKREEELSHDASQTHARGCGCVSRAGARTNRRFGDPEWIAIDLASGAVQRRGRALGLRPASLLVAARMVSRLRLAPSVVVAASLASLVAGNKREGGEPSHFVSLALV
jgi:hypothetical protein